MNREQGQQLDETRNFSSTGRLLAGSVSALTDPSAPVRLVIERRSGDELDRCEVLALFSGHPRFTDPQMETQRRQSGCGAAWIDGYRRHGEGVFARARGSFSVVLIDRAAGQVLLATDRFAVCPLCYTAERQRLAFASRADALPDVPADLDAQQLFHYLYFHVIPSPGTIFAHVRRLEPGHYLRWSASGTEVLPYWSPHFEEGAMADFPSLREQFRRLLEEAVAREADRAEVGAFLSGGTDSSTVSGMLCKVTGRPARTFSIGFAADGYDEMAYARIAARHFGTEHHEYYVTPDDLVQGIPQVAAYYDQPFGNSSAVPAYYCARLALASGVEKMLGGDGGDEFFGGNARYAKQRVFSWYQKLPAPLRAYVLEPALGRPGVGRIPLLRKAASYCEQARFPMPDRFTMYNLLTRIGAPEILTADVLARIDQQAPLRDQRAVYQASGAHSLINCMLAYDWKFTLADNDLPKVYGTASLAGVQVAFPFLSEELVDFSASLPPEYKLKGLKLRWFFKEALRGFLPDEIITKKKQGFGLPFGVWALQHQGLRKLAADTLKSLETRAIVQPRFIRRLLSELHPAHPGYYGEMVWILMILEHWLQAHAPDARFD